MSNQKYIFVFEDEEEEKKMSTPNVFGVSMVKGYGLYNHQVEAVKWMMDIEKLKNHVYGMKGGVLALKMGLGKTLCTTTLCMSEKSEFPSLVVCSKTVSGEWVRDISKFFGDTCKCLVFHKESLSSFNNITRDEICKYNIVITTYETVMSYAKTYKKCESLHIYDSRDRKIGVRNSTRPSGEYGKGGMLLFSIPWRRIVADESHRFSNPSTMTFSSMMCLYGENKFCLSGTPIRNYSSDMYSQLRFCGYKNTVVSTFNYELYKRQKLDSFLLCKDYADSGIVLPDIIEHVVPIKLEDREKEIYDYYHNHAKRAYSGFLVGNIDFSNVLVLFLRLRQLCVCPHTIVQEREKEDSDVSYSYAQTILDNMTNGLVEWINDKSGSSGMQCTKIKKMIDILSDVKDGEKTLVFSSFKKVINLSCQALDKYMPNKKYLVINGDVVGKQRDEILSMFKDDKLGYDVLFISYKVGSEGLNLVEANHIIMCENWWTPVVQQQAQARSHRIGQKNDVHVWKLIIEESIESNIEAICKKKSDLIGDFMKNVKKRSGTALNADMMGRILRR